MQCPLCSVDLVMSERQGIEIDYCPKCRGVWLDRGELDKIIERSESQTVSPQQAQPVRDDHYQDRNRDHDRSYNKEYDRSRDRDYSHSSKKKHKGGFLGDLFEFGD